MPFIPPIVRYIGLNAVSPTLAEGGDGEEERICSERFLNKSNETAR